MLEVLKRRARRSSELHEDSNVFEVVCEFGQVVDPQASEWNVHWNCMGTLRTFDPQGPCPKEESLAD